MTHVVDVAGVGTSLDGGSEVLLVCSCGWSDRIIDPDQGRVDEVTRRHVQRGEDARAAAEDQLADQIEGRQRTEL